MRAKRDAWRAGQPALDPARLVFLDETWASTNMTRTHGRCPRGERLVMDAPHGHWKTTTFVAALRHDRLVYLGDGSWGMLRTPVAPEKRPYLAHVSKAYHLTVHKLEGPDRYHVALAEGGRVADVFHTGGKRPARRG